MVHDRPDPRGRLKAATKLCFQVWVFNAALGVILSMLGFGITIFAAIGAFGVIWVPLLLVIFLGYLLDRSIVIDHRR